MTDTWKFKCPAKCFYATKAGRVAIESFAMRETDGRDEENAAKIADDGKTSITEQLMAMALVEVNDAPVKQPYTDFGSWNSKARSLAARAWTSINGVDKEEADRFLSDAEPVTG